MPDLRGDVRHPEADPEPDALTLLLSRRAALLAPLHAPLLAHPAAAASCLRAPIAVMPLRLIEGYPIVPAGIAGQSVTLLLDTGAQGMLVTPQVAEALSLPLRGMIPMYGTGGSREARVVLLPGLRLGGVPMPDQLSPVAPLPVDFTLQPPLAGLLGATLLSRFDLDIDVPGQRLSLYLPEECALPFAGHTLPLEVTPQGEPFVPVQVNGQSLLALLDTGTRATILSESTARRLGLQVPVSANVAEGVDGTRRAIGHTRVRMTLGDMPAAETPVSVSALQIERGDMLLGLDAILRRRVWLSYARGQVTFGPVVPGP